MQNFMTDVKINKKKIILSLLFSFCFGGLLLPNLTRASFEISDGSVLSLYHLSDGVDSSGNNYNLTSGGTTGVSYVAGKFGNAVSIPTTNGYLYGGLPVRTTNGSISLWFKTSQSTSADNKTFVANSVFSGFYHIDYSLSHDDTNKYSFYYTYGNNQYSYWQSTDTLTTLGHNNNAWHYLAVKWHYANPNDFSLIVDGVVVPGLWTNGSQTLSEVGGYNGAIGSSYYVAYNTNNFGGVIDDLAIMSGLISTTTIEGIYNGGDGNEICVIAGCAEEGTTTPTTTASCTLDMAGGNRIDRIYYSAINSTSANGTIQTAGEYRSPLIYFLFLLLTTGACMMIIAYYVYIKKNSNIKLYGNKPRR